MGNLRPVHPASVLAGERSWGSPTMGSCPSQAYILLSLPISPAGVKTVTVTLAQTQPHKHLEPRGQKLKSH